MTLAPVLATALAIVPAPIAFMAHIAAVIAPAWLLKLNAWSVDGWAVGLPVREGTVAADTLPSRGRPGA